MRQQHTHPSPLFNAHPPCENCTHTQKCKEGKIACEDFYLFVRGYEFGTNMEKRIPNMETFLKVMKV